MQPNLIWLHFKNRIDFLTNIALLIQTCKLEMLDLNF